MRSFDSQWDETVELRREMGTLGSHIHFLGESLRERENDDSETLMDNRRRVDPYQQSVGHLLRNQTIDSMKPLTEEVSGYREDVRGFYKQLEDLEVTAVIEAGDEDENIGMLTPLIHVLARRWLEEDSREVVKRRTLDMQFGAVIEALYKSASSSAGWGMNRVLVTMRRWQRDFGYNMLRMSTTMITGAISKVLSSFHNVFLGNQGILGLIGFGKDSKSVEEKILQAINRQTEFFLTGKIDLSRSFSEKLHEFGILGASLRGVGNLAMGAMGVGKKRHQDNVIETAADVDTSDRKITQKIGDAISKQIYGDVITKYGKISQLGSELPPPQEPFEYPLIESINDSLLKQLGISMMMTNTNMVMANAMVKAQTGEQSIRAKTEARQSREEVNERVLASEETERAEKDTGFLKGIHRQAKRTADEVKKHRKQAFFMGMIKGVGRIFGTLAKVAGSLLGLKALKGYGSKILGSLKGFTKPFSSIGKTLGKILATIVGGKLLEKLNPLNRRGRRPPKVTRNSPISDEVKNIRSAKTASRVKTGKSIAKGVGTAMVADAALGMAVDHTSEDSRTGGTVRAAKSGVDGFLTGSMWGALVAGVAGAVKGGLAGAIGGPAGIAAGALIGAGTGGVAGYKAGGMIGAGIGTAKGVYDNREAIFQMEKPSPLELGRLDKYDYRNLTAGKDTADRSLLTGTSNEYSGKTDGNFVMSEDPIIRQMMIEKVEAEKSFLGKYIPFLKKSEDELPSQPIGSGVVPAGIGEQGGVGSSLPSSPIGSGLDVNSPPSSPIGKTTYVDETSDFDKSLIERIKAQNRNTNSRHGVETDKEYADRVAKNRNSLLASGLINQEDIDNSSAGVKGNSFRSGVSIGMEPIDTPSVGVKGNSFRSGGSITSRSLLPEGGYGGGLTESSPSPIKGVESKSKNISTIDAVRETIQLSMGSTRDMLGEFGKNGEETVNTLKEGNDISKRILDAMKEMGSKLTEDRDVSPFSNMFDSTINEF